MLSKLTTDQIRKEAEAHYPIDETYKDKGVDKQYLLRQAYNKGATAWAIWKEKAEGLELRAISKMNPDGVSARKIATKALEQFGLRK